MKVAFKQKSTTPPKCFYFLTSWPRPLIKRLIALDEILTRASKKPKKENPTKSPKVPPSSATWRSRHTLTIGGVGGVSGAQDKTHQWGEGIDELLHLQPELLWQLQLNEQVLPCIVGDRPHGEEIKIWFHSRCLLLLEKAIPPLQLFTNHSDSWGWEYQKK